MPVLTAPEGVLPMNQRRAFEIAPARGLKREVQTGSGGIFERHLIQQLLLVAKPQLILVKPQAHVHATSRPTAWDASNLNKPVKAGIPRGLRSRRNMQSQSGGCRRWVVSRSPRIPQVRTRPPGLTTGRREQQICQRIPLPPVICMGSRQLWALRACRMRISEVDRG